jgi:hypothetical protein
MLKYYITYIKQDIFGGYYVKEQFVFPTLLNYLIL